ncbi:hypothetical protein [Maritimibacter sp. UBA3975]|uniref:hypothetical protein n=1 Tax=Maritimibacter sp. UBA3975 TaxID=1946833 RepID=UPI000C094B18|nr:hypothetical protein [Maritimibacter sp. UBA3975]MAM61139.1 hypothetical protein [Maritimibacter sp.]|tara:strand:- start:13180 stop:13440 length:261 start_codon:yes stop_codon:yes gene_type:complete
MAEHTSDTTSTTVQSDGGNTWLAIIVGILVVVVAIIAWFVFGDASGNANGGIDVSIDRGYEPENSIGEAVGYFEGTVDDSADGVAR